MPLPSNVDWRSVNDHIRLNYERIMEQSLNQIQIPHIVYGCTMCHETDHIFQIERYYSEIIRCIELADQSLPRCKPSLRKTYWNDELTDLKNDSIVAHDFWIMNGKPRTGVIYEAKKNAYYRYKLRIRECKNEFSQNKADRLNEDLLHGDSHKFWRSFKYHNYSKTSQSPRIDGLVNDVDIANCFADNYRNVYESVNLSRADALSREFYEKYNDYCCKHNND